MGVIKDKINSWVKKATETATETVKQIAKDDVNEKLDILEGIAKIVLFSVITVGAVNGVHKIAPHVKVEDTIKPIADVSHAAAPIVQIFVGEGKGVRIE